MAIITRHPCLNHFPTASQFSPTRPIQTASTDLNERKGSFAPPMFEEKAIKIRRISHNASEPDIFQMVKAFTSTLYSADDPGSEMLPFGGRKSSVPSIFSSMLIKFLPNEVMDAGERRPSVLSSSCGVEGELSVRRVSTAGVEEVVRVRGTSIPSITSNEASLSPNVNPPPTPATNLALPSFAQEPVDRRHSVTLHFVGTSGHNVASEELESIRSVQSESFGGLFHAWRGFPPKSETSALPTALPAAVENISNSLREERRFSKVSGRGKITYLAENVYGNEKVEQEEGPPVIPLPDALIAAQEKATEGCVG